MKLPKFSVQWALGLVACAAAGVFATAAQAADNPDIKPYVAKPLTVPADRKSVV